tara:strand:+ start:1020 stop:1334 length:315 start_codon:yes stop_codon:yes gene_type:complete
VIEEENSKLTYMALLDDLFTEKSSPHERFHESNQKMPNECYECSGDAITSLEILGVGSIFWVCLECDALYLKLDIEETLNQLEGASGIWTNPNDWGYKDDDEFN